jgi:type III pantothenate kinase
MNLLLDIGNSRVKMALVDDDQWLEETAAELDDQRSDWPVLDAVAAAPDRVLAVNVAGVAVASSLAQRLHSLWRLPLELAESAAEFAGLRNGYRDPQQLGADRWLAMLAARRATPGAICVVDAGTALTVDLVEADGRHLGGFILPGPGLMREALERSTGNIRERSLDSLPAINPQSPGRDTGSAISAAALQASLGLIERARSMTSTPARVVVSGGAAPGLLGGLGQDALHRPRLVLEGLLLALAIQPGASGA